MLDVNNAARARERQPPRRPARSSRCRSRRSACARTSPAPRSLNSLPLMLPGVTMASAHVGDVAQVVDGYVDHRLISTVNNRDSVQVLVSRDTDSDTVGTTKAIRAAFKQLAVEVSRARLPRGRRRQRVHDAVDQRRAPEPRRGHPADRDRAAAVPARLAQRAGGADRDPGSLLATFFVLGCSASRSMCSR